MLFEYQCFLNTDNNYDHLTRRLLLQIADEWRVLVIRFVSFVLFSSSVFGYTFGFLAFGSYFTQVHLKKKGSFEQQQRCIFFNFPCVRLTRIRFLFFFLLRLYLWKKKFVAACVWFRVLFLLLLCSLVFFLLYTGAFQEERFIWTRKVHFFLLAMCYINTYSFFFCFGSPLPVKKRFSWCMCMIPSFVFASSWLFGFFRTLHRCIWRRNVHLNKKGAFFLLSMC